jgi:glucosamine-6-phosphate deaminase
MNTPLNVLPSPDAIGEYIAEGLLRRIEDARKTTRRFLLGCPTGRTPRPIFAAMARRLAETKQDLSHLVLVMMDEYLVSKDGALEYASAGEPWSCHFFAKVEIARRLNAPLPPSHRLDEESIWFPDPRDPAAYDRQIAGAGGIDFFMLASGASDGHVAFNPPGSPRDSRTRIIPLSDETRSDNLQTFPAFGSLANVPHHGISVGIATITSSKEAAMIVFGIGKRLTLSRIRRAERYEPDWPATLIHECAMPEIVSDTEAGMA